MGKKMSIKEIAKLSGVSVSTVSRVINDNGRFSEDTRQRVLKTIKKYNYQTNTLAKGLRMRRSNTIGIIVPDLSNTFFSSLVEKMENQFFRKIIPRLSVIREETLIRKRHIFECWRQN
ncbi:ribose operon repressor [Liquorilactobacillus sucicola DSM 21376 = JCM 15457]|uniref:LacI family DNA-binding transcriptional regulator n=1 Tax=Liquorilactobacillus sucicola TaxID=519050 RepID=UPI0004347192|nr:LacI family DNA-binding transcriptional regulator [Liquorilactobacillus sucicola]GAJ26231.1 ribose operon repressor [Liquorilactobacillus sucicola DSM 21376 = JCM 15457]